MKKCSKCGVEKELDCFINVKRYKGEKYSWCKTCSSISSIEYQKNLRKNDPLAYYKKSSWSALNQRTSNGKYSNSESTKHSPQLISYLKKGRLLLITKEELFKFWEDNRELVLEIIKNGDIPTIDRIEDEGHYELSNMQILSRKENIRKSRGISKTPSTLSKEEKRERNKKQYLDSKTK